MCIHVRGISLFNLMRIRSLGIFRRLIPSWSYMMIFIILYYSQINAKVGVTLEFPDAVVSNINTIHIPFQFTGRLITIDARIGMVEGHFLFDTGAERLVLNKSYFTADQPGLVAGFGNSGRVDMVQQDEVDSLFLDRLLISNLRAHIVDLSHIETKKNIRLHGILGYQVFKEFEILIDYPSKIITLSRLGKSGDPVENRGTWEQKVDSLHFFLDHHMIVFNGEISGKKLRFMLDTGAEVNLLDRLVGRRVLKNFKILRRMNLTGVGKNEVEVLAGLLTGFRCSLQEPKEMHTLLTSLDGINVAFRSSIQGVLGYEFLFDKRILINYKKEKLFFLLPNKP